MNRFRIFILAFIAIVIDFVGAAVSGRPKAGTESRPYWGCYFPELMPTKILFIVFSVLIWGSGIAFGWPWSHDLDYHPSYDTQEDPLDPSLLSIPTDGKEKIMTREEADKSLVNPLGPSEESVKKGQEFYRIYCAACHGPGGKGDGPVAPKFFPPPNLSLPLTQGRTDGYIFGTITHGGTIMPGYRAALSSEDRWHVVNYVRSLKGK